MVDAFDQLKATCELSDDGKKIDVWFLTSKATKHLTEAVRTIPGRRMVKKPSRHWVVPLDLSTARMLRKAFGDDMELGPKLKAWGHRAVGQQNVLGSVALSSVADIPRLRERLPRLWRALYLGPLYRNATQELGYTDKEINRWVELCALMAGKEPWAWEAGSYQTADVRFLTDSVAPANFNQQGLGKTPVHVGAVWESGLEHGEHLVIAPATAVDGTWEPELLQWHEGTPEDVEIFACTGSRKDRERTLAAFHRSEAAVKWCVVNPGMIKYRKQIIKEVEGYGWVEEVVSDDPFNPSYFKPSQIARRAKPKDHKRACGCKRLKDPHWHYVASYPEIMDTHWRTICVDECHKGSIRNHRSLSSFSIEDLLLAPDGKKFTLSGTPMKKKHGVDIWGILHWLRPDIFTNYWQFANMFFEVKSNGFGRNIGPLRSEMEEEFWEFLAPYVLRRLKSEAAPWLPPKQWIPVPVKLRDAQLRQYKQMEEEGMAVLGDGTFIETTGLLAEYVRLSQFANAYSTMDAKGTIVPTRESAKLDALFQKLEEAGILDGSTTEQTVIFSQYKQVVNLIAAELVGMGVPVATLTGDHNRQGVRRAIKEAFQAGQTKVLVIVTTAGGVSLTLDAADSAHFVDTSWAPDDDEQAEDRIHRTSKIHQVRIYQYFAEGTIDEDRMAVSIEKEDSHKYILDVRREMLRRKAANAQRTS